MIVEDAKLFLHSPRWLLTLALFALPSSPSALSSRRSAASLSGKFKRTPSADQPAKHVGVFDLSRILTT